ncbi:MAG TPA: hypothetical protein VGI81_08190 [Tepidisphaeraceae bacterium]|jgi:hypothetical protein
MRQVLALALIAAVAPLFVAVAVPSASAKAPEPSIYPIAWQFDFKHGAPRRIVVDNTPYWYVTYTVTNNTGQEQEWRPEFTMMTNEGKLVKSDRDIEPGVFDKIKAIEGGRFLQPRLQVVGPLRQGPDQAKDSVAIWKEPQPRMGSFKIFIGGLSGEFVILKDDNGNEKKGPDGLPVILHKTLQLDYQVIGDERNPQTHDLQELGQKWVMR